MKPPRRRRNGPVSSGLHHGESPTGLEIPTPPEPLHGDCTRASGGTAPNQYIDPESRAGSGKGVRSSIEAAADLTWHPSKLYQLVGILFIRPDHVDPSPAGIGGKPRKSYFPETIQVIKEFMALC